MSKHFDGELLSGYEESSKYWQLKDKDKTIADLEAKLTRLQTELSAKVEYIHELVEIKDDYKKQLAEAEEHIDNLELQLREQYQLVDEKDEQLAEKEKELKFIKEVKTKELGSAMAVVIENLSEQIKNINESTLLDILQSYNQDQISFAVEQLEKVKEKLNDYDIQEILSSSSDPYGEFDENCVTTDNINTIIDNQIKALKEGKTVSLPEEYWVPQFNNIKNK